MGIIPIGDRTHLKNSMSPGWKKTDPSDEFSDFGDGHTETTSLGSSVLNYTYENGRRYHAYRAGQYVLPNDETEQERLDMVHHLFSLTLKGDLCAAKLHNPQNILDLGTGTGIWAIDMGDAFPSAKVIGTDLSPIQPNWTPPNVMFEVDDASSDWTFPENHFDFIHARTLGGGIRDWPALLRRCYRHIKPGGKIEISEGRANFYCDDGTMAPDSHTSKWLTEFHKIGASIGLKLDFIEDIPMLLEEAGFEDASLMNRVVPVGSWPKNKALKRIGAVFRLQFLESGLEAYSSALFTRSGWSELELQVLLAHVRNELLSNQMHLYTYTTFVTATKPSTSV
ncbi:S-adenosyl-L-methionine-dependent methyltransferase [Mollisia scopiformis]|uniref:S-adenosyl-L-methionine-dependent methyltransferase n=1 Tax=Mollisia scopiformis TaxID=149040 RepID=A0A194XKQ3_MOLSC|nr:S-adenosyl-L-methionine-dependent methyltransferase [Mollisia scopiformis]KUJ20795.1 S-adenosyl-L-methionine-dependent methyltransferase [Mollisia scopiformis]